MIIQLVTHLKPLAGLITDGLICRALSWGASLQSLSAGRPRCQKKWASPAASPKSAAAHGLRCAWNNSCVSCLDFDVRKAVAKALPFWWHFLGRFAHVQWVRAPGICSHWFAFQIASLNEQHIYFNLYSQCKHSTLHTFADIFCREDGGM